MNFGVLYAKEVPLQGRENLSLRPLHSSISTVTPHFMLIALLQTLTCSESQPPPNPSSRGWAKLGPVGASTQEGAQNLLSHPAPGLTPHRCLPQQRSSGGPTSSLSQENTEAK